MRALRLLALSLALCLLGGCGSRWIFGDYREIDQLELIQALGLDAEGETVVATATTAGNGETPVVLRSRARSVSRAMRQMQDYTSRKYIFFGHTGHLLLGEAAASASIRPWLEHMERNVEMRLNTFLYIVRDGTAEEAVSAPALEGEGVVPLLNSLEKDVQLMNESHVFTCGEVAESLAERGSALAAAVSLVRQEDILAGESPVSIRTRGYAILKEDRLAGWLDPQLARGANLLMGLGGEDILEVPDGSGSWAALRLTDSRAAYLPEFKAGELRSLGIRIELECSLEELPGSTDTWSREALEDLERRAEETELELVCRVLERSRELEADFCGIGARLRQAAPLAWDGMRADWGDLFPVLPLKVEVECRLLRTYDVGLSPLRRQLGGET